MKYFSTRNRGNIVSAAQAIKIGLSPDGGLFVPESLPAVSLELLEQFGAMDYRGRAAAVMRLFLDEFDDMELSGFAKRAYAENFDCAEIAPLRRADENTAFLELWHGPTCAFKDMALQMLPRLLTASLKKCGEMRKVCILVATSGDTGKAALEGFRDVPGTSILVFYPRDGVSDVQKLQMVTQQGENVGVCSVNGNFDDAQGGVKTIFGDRDFAAELSGRGYFLSSANSINWGRLLPQIVYYISAYCDSVNSGIIKPREKLNFCVPTGNFGNILACWYAKRMGLPVGRIICASNKNNVLTDFIRTGVYDRNRGFYTSISPSMDILVSSNLERLIYSMCEDDRKVAGYMSELHECGRYEVGPDIKSAIAADFEAGFCDDDETKAAIARVWKKFDYLMDTHTAVAYKVMSDYREKSGDAAPTVIVSTASPFKFCEDVLDALGVNPGGNDPIAALSDFTGMEIPAPLGGLMQRPVRFTQTVEKSGMRDVADAFLRQA